MPLTACQQDQLQFPSAQSTSAAALLCSHTTKVSPPPSMGNCTFLVLPRLRLSVWADANSICKFMAELPLLWSSSVISQDNPWCQLSTGPSSSSQMSSAEDNLKPIWLLEHPNLGGVLKLLELRGEEILKAAYPYLPKHKPQIIHFVCKAWLVQYPPLQPPPWHRVPTTTDPAV